MFKDVVSTLQLEGYQDCQHGGNLATLLHMLPIYVQPIPKVDLLCVSAKDSVYYAPGLSGKLTTAVTNVCNQVRQYVAETVEACQNAH